MGINPADYDVDDNIGVGYESARLGYPLKKGESAEHKKGWEDFHKHRQEECEALGIPFRKPIRL